MIATAGTPDLDYVCGLGADEVIDFRSTRFENVTGLVDAVIDTVGGETQQRSFSVLRRGGVLVSAVSEPQPEEAARRGVRALFILVDVGAVHLARIAEMIDDGKLTASVGAVLPLADARRAHQMPEGTLPRPRGKIVLSAGG